jgi:hypothetical protein
MAGWEVGERFMKIWMIALVALLLIAHQDYWNWDDGRLVWGVLPMGLFYHLGISLAAAVVWLMGVTLAWPKSFSALDAQMAKSDPSGNPRERG